MRKTMIALLAVVALAASWSSVAEGAGGVTIKHGGHAMSLREIQSLQGNSQTFQRSAEGQKLQQRAALHCYGAVKWKAGVNVFGITLWKEWNHTSWCGRRGVAIKDGSVQGYTDIWTGPVWTGGDTGWRKWRDPVHPQTEAHTESNATFGEGAGCCTIGSETVRVRMTIFASGVWR